MLLGAMLFWTVCGLAAATARAAEPGARILYIASYHPTFHSFPPQRDGFVDGLAAAGFPAGSYVLDFEFLDAKRFRYEDRAVHLERDLARKLETLPPYDLIVASDDDALRFAMERLDGLFKGANLVFLAVNDLGVAQAQNANRRVVGVAEQQSFIETIDLAVRLFPHAAHLHVTGELTTTAGRINEEEMLLALAARPDLPVVRHYFSDLTYDAFFERMSRVPDDEPLLLLPGFVDAAGNTLTGAGFLKRLRTVYDGPVLMTQSHSIGAGVLGGKVVSHLEQGRAAAGLAARILAGVDPGTLRVIADSPNVFMADHRELARLGVPARRLPPGTILLNAPQSLFGRYGPWAIAGILVLGFQLALIVVLVRSRRRHRRAESALRDSEATLRAFFDNSPSVMYVKDTQHRMKTVNARYLEMHGVTENQVTGQRGGQPLPDAQRRAVEAADTEVIAGRKPFQKTISMKTADGGMRSFMVMKFPIVDAAGTVTGVGGINTDVTELHDREEKLVAAGAAAERAMREAQAANRTKSEFLANMSHEIRTPMNGVLGAATVLANSSLTAAQRENVETIQESGAALLGLLNDILDLSKIEAGRLVIEEVDFSLATLLRSTQALWEGPAQDKGLRLEIANRVASRDAFSSDANRLRQILNNLVGNAIKFTETGAVTIRVSESAASGGGSELCFEVCDTGIGITDAQRALLFRPFTQADATITRKFGGTGLGLSICRELAGLMGGEIRLASSSAAGSVFAFRVPVRPGDSRKIAVCGPAHIDAARTGAADLPILPGGRPLRILLAEDNDINRKVVVWLLAPLKCQLDEVTTGLEAIAAVTRSPYDLVLMDVQMPEMDGLTAAEKIRALPGAVAAIPIIALTANAMQGDRERYLAAGMNGYVAKPIDQRELFAAIRACLDLPDAPPLPLPLAARAAAASTPPDAASSDAAALFEELDDLIVATAGDRIG